MFKIKRIYNSPEKDDGYRILVDRLWPRGVSKEKAKLDMWMKDIAPTNELRKWFGHDPEKWDGFKNKYLNELKDKKELIKQMKIIEKHNENVTLLYSAKDEQKNNAVVLMEVLGKPSKKIVTSVSRIHGS